MNYTHNLKIILFDKNYNIIEDEIFLDEIKNILCQLNIQKIQWNGKNEDIQIKWDKKKLSNINRHFMGDLFSTPIYNIDSIIVNHANEIISRINNKSNYIIKFYIFKLIGDNKNCPDTCGIII